MPETLAQKWQTLINEAKAYPGDRYGIDPKLRDHFCLLLRESLHTYTLNQAELAKGIKRTYVTVNKWFNARTYPTYKTMIEIRDYLKTQQTLKETLNAMENTGNRA